MKLTSLVNGRFKSCLMCCFFLLLGVATVEAQTVKGTVTGEGEALIGVNVLIKGTLNGTQTDFDGMYEITAGAGDTLQFSYIGYETQEIVVGVSTVIDVDMATNTNALEEVVVVGYGTQKKKEVTGAVVKVGEDVIGKTATADLGTALQGQVAGVNIQASSGRPGEQANVQIRGLGSISAGGLGPLYVVDGIPYENNPNIAPEQIESIDILKDGAAASIYGTRASNGVILITTKRGAVGKMQVDFNSYAGIQNITSGTPLMDTRQQLYHEDVMLEALGRDPILFLQNPDAMDYNSDYVGDVQNDNAMIQNYNLFVSGGVKNLTLSLNTNYFNQEGVLINSGFDRLSNRVTGEFTKGRFKAFATVGFTTENREQEPWALYEYGIGQNPWQRPLSGIETAGENSYSLPVQNEIFYSYLSQQLDNVDEREVNSSNIAINAQYEILPGLSFKVNLGRNTWDYQRKFFRPQYLVFGRDGEYKPTASRPNAQLDEDYTFTKKEALENVLNYNKQFGKHKLDFVGVLSYEQFESRILSTGVVYSETASNDIQTLGAGAEATKPSSFNENRTISGKMARVQYNYDDRYLFSASFRRDGSSKFSEKNRYGNFKGFSAGWNIHEEKFFESDLINSLKLRASWGEVGNQNIASYAFAPVISSGINYPFGPNEELDFGLIQRSYVDDDIRWETTISQNIGIDVSLIDYRLNFSADFYINDKEDMLLQERLPASSGTYQTRAQGVYDVKVINAGNMTNRGVELSLNYQGVIKEDFTYKLTSTFTKNKNEVTDLNGVTRGYANGRPVVSLGTNIDYTTFLAEGYEAGAFFLIQNDGVIKTQEELDAYKGLDPSAQLGDIRYVDQNGDGAITDSDRIYAGSGQPDFEAGLGLNLNFKNLDFFIQGYYVHGAEIYNGAKLYAYAQGRHEDLYYMWTPQNADSDIPTSRQNAYHNNVRARSDFFLEDGTYLRIRNITLGYTIPQTRKYGFERTRIYLSALNPFTFTNYDGYDPEVGGDGIFTRGVDRGNYPVTRQFTGGIQLSF